MAHAVQLAEIAMDGDMLVLATPEIAGLPYVISALVAAGGLAASSSFAPGRRIKSASRASFHPVSRQVMARLASVSL